MMQANITVANFSQMPIDQLIRYGAKIKTEPRHYALLRAIKKVVSSWAGLKPSPDKTGDDLQRDVDSRGELLGVRKKTAKNIGRAQPGRHGNAADVGIGRRAAILNKTENLVFRTRTTPGKAVSLPIGVEPRVPVVVEPEAQPERGTPSVPTSLPVDKGRSKRLARAARQQAGMLLSWPTHGVNHGDVKGGMMEVVTCPETLRSYAGSLFSDPQQGAALNQLMLDLHQALESHHTALQLSSHVTLLRHLAHVCAGDAERTLAALHALQAGELQLLSADFFQIMQGRYPSRHRPPQAHLDALSVAAQLSTDAVQFKMLLALTGSRFCEQQHDSLQRLLQAVTQIETDSTHESKTKDKKKNKNKTEAVQGRPVDLWHHLLRALLDVESGQASLPQLVLYVESFALQHTDEVSVELSTEQKVALFSWTQGFRQHGKGSDLELLQQRLYKLIIYIQRAAHAQDLNDVHFDRDQFWQSGLRLIDAQARIMGAHLNQAVGRKKSPLGALAKFGVNNAWMMQPEAELRKLYETTETGVDLLHARLRRTLEKLPAAEVRPQLQDPQAPLPALLEHVALLAYWKTLLAWKKPLGHRLDEVSTRALAARIAQDYDGAAFLSTLEEKLQHWIGHELKVDDLNQWAVLHPAPAGNPDAGVDISADAECRDEERLSEALRKATAASTGRSFPVDLSQDEMHKFIRRYLCEHNIGNTVATSNGSTIGVNTTPLTSSIKKINECLSYVFPVTVTPAVDVRLSSAHNAMINFGSTTHGCELFIGKQKQKSASLGAGFNVNVSPFLKYLGVKAGTGSTAAAGCDYVKTEGVMVRSKRVVSADGSCLDTPQARAELVDFADLIFEIAKEKPKTLNPETVWKRIAERFFDSKTLSIGWQEQREVTPHLTGTLGLYTRLGVAIQFECIGSAGLNTARTISFTPVASFNREEKSGATRQIRSSNFTRQQQITSVGAVGTGTSVPIHTTGANTESLNCPQISRTLNFQDGDQGDSIIFRTLMEQGELSPLFTLREMEQRDAQTFCKTL